MNNKKYSLSLLIVLLGTSTHSVVFAESGAKKGNKAQQAPVINMPIMVPVKTKALTQPLCTESA